MATFFASNSQPPNEIALTSGDTISLPRTPEQRRNKVNGTESTEHRRQLISQAMIHSDENSENNEYDANGTFDDEFAQEPSSKAINQVTVGIEQSQCSEHTQHTQIIEQGGIVDSSTWQSIQDPSTSMAEKKTEESFYPSTGNLR